MSVIECITASLADIRARSQKLVQLNVELLTAELKKKAQEYGGAIGMQVAGALLAVYALGFALATIAVALALVLPLWLSLLIVTPALSLIIAILVLAARGVRDTGARRVVVGCFACRGWSLMAEETTTSKRTPAEIARDIAAEHEGLESAFDSLSAELQQAADSAAEKARTAGRKALVVAPAVAVAVGALIGTAVLLRRRPHRDR